jgi:cellulose synthase/poly-beta-1,6-N-acetylglucosamine synthase-like glycosyltransferase
VITTVLTVAGIAAGSIALAHGVWWCSLSVLALPRARTASAVAAGRRFAVLVPAHNEERMLGFCLASLRKAGAGHAVNVIVIADNCTDATAAIAGRLGARVLIRRDEAHRGKPYALDHALQALRRVEDPPDAVVVVDADSEVSPNFFEAMERRLGTGSRVVQVHYRVADGDAPLVRLRRLAFLLLHYARPLGASRLGLGTTLKGNGMAFGWEVVKDGFGGTGITEDAAATLALADRGVEVAFEPSAWVSGYMASDYASAEVQDSRWEGGRLGLTAHGVRAGVRAIVRGRIGPAAQAFEVGSLPLTLAGVLATVSLGAATAGFGPLWLPVAALISLAGYVAIGLMAARAKVDDAKALVSAPRFVLHKLSVYARLTRSRPTGWERTQRD